MRKFITLALLPTVFAGAALADDFASVLPVGGDAGVARQVAAADASPWTINDYVASARVERVDVLTLSSFSTEVLIDEAARRL